MLCCPLVAFCPRHLLPLPVLLNSYVCLQPTNRTLLSAAVVASYHCHSSLVKRKILGCCDLQSYKRDVSTQEWSQAELTTLGKEAKVEKSVTEHNASVAKPGGRTLCFQPPSSALFWACCFKLAISVVLMRTSVLNSTTLWERLGCSSRVGVGSPAFREFKKKSSDVCNASFYISGRIKRGSLSQTCWYCYCPLVPPYPYVTLTVLWKGHCINQKFSSRQVNCSTAICFCP